MDRRDFYRIEDRIHLIRTPIEKHLLSDNPYGEQYHIPREALLSSQLQAIDNESRDLLRQVSDSNRALGSYLRYLEEKIDVIANYVVSNDHQLNQKEAVNLSEGGISFYHSHGLEPGQFLHLILVLFPGYTSIACFGVVRTCEKIEEVPVIYRIGVEFEVLLESDRKQIVRHIRRLESREIREQSEVSEDKKS